LLHPADDYVRAFVRDVNRARVLTVDEIMKPPALRLSKEKLDEALRQMQLTGAEYGYVTVDGDYHGVVSVEAVEDAIEGPSDPTLIELAETIDTVDTTASLEEALPNALTTEYDVPVVSDAGELVGVVSRESMSEVLSEGADEPDDDPLLANGAAPEIVPGALPPQTVAAEAAEAARHA
ncbi:MAG: CBS domain-containing protein, partial [Pseudomonadota bacterium]